ncbi:MAG: signal peptide peptidase SppA [Succinivibrio sp.]|nr:signal peptide peptidase SppA [Succinivibrio sp.]
MNNNEPIDFASQTQNLQQNSTSRLNTQQQNNYNYGKERHNQSSPDSEHTFLRCLCKGLAVIGGTISIISNLTACLMLILFIVLFSVISSFFEDSEISSTSSLLSSSPQVEKAPVMYLPLSGEISEIPYSQSEIGYIRKQINEKLGGGQAHEITAIERALNLAAGDDGIKEVLINLEDLNGISVSVAERIGKAMDKFRSSSKNKRITVVSLSYSQNSYIIATHASWVVLDPLGEVGISGIGLNNLYFKDLLKRYNVEPYVFKAGDFKSAVEPFTRSSMSPQVKQEYEQIAASLWQVYNKKIAGRQVVFDKPDQILPSATEYVKQLESLDGDESALALKNKLVDEVKPVTDVMFDFAKLYGTEQNSIYPRTIDYRDYLKNFDNVVFHSSNKVAVVYGIGEITDESESPLDFTPQNIVPLLEKICVNDEIKSVVFYINSPGGSVVASEKIRRALDKVRSHGKKVVIYMNDMAASGAYMISTAGDYLMATDSTITGSIGVFAISPRFDGLLNEQGVNEDGVATHEFAESFIAKEMTDNTANLVQSSINGTYKRFVALVCKARNLDQKDYYNFAEGRIFMAKDALDKGLIDRIGSYDEAITKAEELANLKEDETEVIPLLPEDEQTIPMLQRLILRGSYSFLPAEIVKGELDFFLKSVRKPQHRPEVMAIIPLKTPKL